MADRHFITPDALFPSLHRPDAPTIQDLRDDADAAADPRCLPAAIPAGLDGGPGTGPVVVVCQKGGKRSQLAAAALRARGRDARILVGGHLAWDAAGLPLVSAARPARWVMPLEAGWDALAALWVLRRLIRRDAAVRAVERAWLPQAAEAWQAEELPSDPPTLAGTFGLDHPVLARLPGGPEGLLAGRLARQAPTEALDLIDDWIARPEAAA